MKKTLLLIFTLLAAVVTVQAQSFEFQFHGRPIADGDTVTIAAETDLFGDLSCETNPADNPNNGLILKKLIGATPTITAVLEITDKALNCSQLQWCMGGNCQIFGNAQKLTKQLQPGATEQVQFDANGITGDGYLIAKLTITSPMDVLAVYIRFFSGEYDGIQELNEKTSEHSPSALAKGKVFTMTGQRITDTQAMRRNKGIYIVNGKKQVIKQ